MDKKHDFIIKISIAKIMKIILLIILLFFTACTDRKAINNNIPEDTNRVLITMQGKFLKTEFGGKYQYYEIEKINIISSLVDDDIVKKIKSVAILHTNKQPLINSTYLLKLGYYDGKNAKNGFKVISLHSVD